MGIVGSRVKTDRAWNEIGKSSEEQHAHQRTRCSVWPFFAGCDAICWPKRARRHKDTSSVVSDTGIFLGKNSSTQPSGQTDISGSSLKSAGQTDISGSSLKSANEMESSVSLKIGEDTVSSSQLRSFSFMDLKSATRNFRPDSLLGEGGFGCVYKGWIDEYGKTPVKPGTGLTVAVKTLNHSGLQGHKEWLAEVTYLGQLHHPNLVKLIGFCIEDDKRLLVYEFLQRGSLENHLFRKGAPALSWNMRMKIALGAAKGVEFLHTRERPIIYRDFKTSNILLDGDYMPKLSDFGLAKDGPQGDKSHVSTRVMGTYGYAAPEYVMTGHLSSKSDIYSFGVVLLELLTGKRSMDKTRPSGEQNLAAWARPYLNGRTRLLEIIDSRLESNYSMKGALKAGQIACHCLSRDPKMRPSMGTIVGALEQLQDLEDMANAAESTQDSTGDKTEKPSLSAGFLQKIGKRGSGKSTRQ